MGSYLPANDKSPYTRSIAELASRLTAADAPGRLIAFLGPWGSGKSTLLAHVADRIKSSPHVDRTTEIVEFDAWQNQYSPEIVLSILAELVEPNVDPDAPWYNKLFPVESGRGMLTNLLATTVAVGRGVLRSATGVDAAEVIVDREKLLKRMEGDALAQLESHDSARRAEHSRQEVLSAVARRTFDVRQLQSGRDRVFMIVDNLDRCSPEVLLSVIDALEKTKARGSDSGLAGIHFILPIDERSVSRAIQSRYTTFDDTDVRAFIEKVFFPIYRMPRLDAAMVSEIVDRDPLAHKDLVELSHSVGRVDLGARVIGEVANLLLYGNPRRAIHLAVSAKQRLVRLPDAYAEQVKTMPARLLLFAVCLLEFYPSFARILIERMQAVVNTAVDHSNLHDLIARARGTGAVLGDFADAIEGNEQLLSIFVEIHRSAERTDGRTAACKGFILMLQALDRLGALHER